MPTTRLRAALLAAAAAAIMGAADTASAADGRGRLDAAGGGLAGDLAPVPAVDGGARETFLWQSPRFATPFEFRIDEVAGITYPAAGAAAGRAGPYVRLRGGDVLAATVESLDADALGVSVAGPDGPQRLRIARDVVEAIARTTDGGGYTGPVGLAGWEQTPPDSWRDEAGRIMSDRAGAMVTCDVAAPRRARFDIEVSRERNAEFRLAAVAADRPGDDGYVLQSIENEGEAGLLIVRRAAGRAAIDALPAGAWRGDRLRVALFVDQERGRLAVMLPDAEGAAAERVTEVTLPPAEAVKPSGRIRLELISGAIRLERLAVTAWRTAEPTLRATAETAVTTRSVSLEGFAVTSFDAGRGEYVLTRGGETRRLAAAELEEIRFPDRGVVREDAPLRVGLADGCTLGGELVKVDDRAVWLRRSGIDQAVALPRAAIATIRSQRQVPHRGEPAGRAGTLIAGEDRVRGWLEAGAEGEIAWRPQGSLAAAAFAAEPDAEVEYVARRPDKKPGEFHVGGIGGLVQRDPAGFFFVAILTEDGAAARDGRLQMGDRLLAIAPREKSRYVETKDLDNEQVMNLLRGHIGTQVRLKVTDGNGGNPRDIDLVRGPIAVAGREVLETALRVQAQLAGPDEAAVEDRRAAYPAVIVLRSGDVAPCRIESIDAAAVRLWSPLAGGPDAAAVRVPVTLVKAVEIVPAAASRALDKTLRDRLLTLPRMQRDRPPTHLLRLDNGDYLRGRLVALDDATVTFEVLDTVKTLPRSRVVRIIWLHPDVPRPGGEPAGDAPPAVEPGAEPDLAGLVVQGVSSDGRRMTLVAETLAGNRILGRNRAFGDSAIDLMEVDRLFIGGAVGRDSRDLPFAQWTLRPAPEPRALSKPAGK